MKPLSSGNVLKYKVDDKKNKEPSHEFVMLHALSYNPAARLAPVIVRKSASKTDGLAEAERKLL